MSNKNIVIVKYNTGGYLDEYMFRKGIRLEPAYERANILDKLVRKLDMPIFNRLENISINKKLCDLSGVIIVFDSGIKDCFLKILKEKNPKARIIYWYWNRVDASFNLNPLRVPEGIEVWTYSLADAKKYCFRYNTQFYFIDIPKSYNNEYVEQEYDMCFIGCDKGRKKTVKSIMDSLITMGKKPFTYITPSSVIGMVINKTPFLSYRECLEYTVRSRSILDIYNNPNAGFSLRVMEAMFLNKKLITNNNNIYEAEFYNESNIFVIRNGNIDEISDFLDKPSIPVDEEVKRTYDFSSWLSRFGI